MYYGEFKLKTRLEKFIFSFISVPGMFFISIGFLYLFKFLNLFIDNKILRAALGIIITFIILYITILFLKLLNKIFSNLLEFLDKKILSKLSNTTFYALLIIIIVFWTTFCMIIINLTIPLPITLD